MSIAQVMAGTRGRWLLLLVVILLLPPLLMDNEGYYLRIATLVLMFAGLGGAWNILCGFAAQISLGHAAFFGLGAYTSTMLLNIFGTSPWVGMLAAGVVSGVACLIIAVPTFRLRGHYFALGTIAFAEILRVLFLYFRDYTGGAVGLTVPFLGESLWNFQFFGCRGYYITALVMLAITFGAGYYTKTSRLGYQLRALSNSHVAAEVVGVDTYRAKLKASLMSAVLTGFWGVFYAQYIYFIDPDTVFSFWSFSVKIAMVVILGGLGSIFGPLVGALILVPLDELTNAVFTGGMAAFSRLVYGAMLVTLILWQPRGILYWAGALLARIKARPALGGREREAIP